MDKFKDDDSEVLYLRTLQAFIIDIFNAARNLSVVDDALRDSLYQIISMDLLVIVKVLFENQKDFAKLSKMICDFGISRGYIGKEKEDEIKRFLH